MSTTGEMIRVKSRDGFELDAYQVKPAGHRKGGIIVIQEIFGISAHIQNMAERFAAEGYEAIAPSMFDRGERGFVVAPEDSEKFLQRGIDLVMANGPENAMNDIGGCLDELSKGGGPVFVTGYCYGGTMSWLASSRLDGIAAASCYYGGRIPDMASLPLKNPVICHFGSQDTSIPMEKVEAVKAARPDVPVYVYDADHAFARKGGSHYNEAADKLAFERTIALFGQVAK
ncbi:MAG: dienelactone hydrolase family protein [Alphaproteobacteria bacterium]